MCIRDRDFMRWMIFQQAVPRMQEVKHWMEEEAEKKGFGLSLIHILIRISTRLATALW